jgi:hypothetical protein
MKPNLNQAKKAMRTFAASSILFQLLKLAAMGSLRSWIKIPDILCTGFLNYITGFEELFEREFFLAVVIQNFVDLHQ